MPARMTCTYPRNIIVDIGVEGQRDKGKEGESGFGNHENSGSNWGRENREVEMGRHSDAEFVFGQTEHEMKEEYGQIKKCSKPVWWQRYQLESFTGMS